MADYSGDLPGAAHSVAGTVNSLNANYKEVYGKLVDLVPANTKMAKMIEFAQGDKRLGNKFNEPVVLGLEGGLTYGGSEGEAFALAAPASFQLKNAEVRSVEMVLRSAVSVGVLSRSQANSFERGMKLLTGNMLKSMYHRLEVSLLYGQSGIGVVDSITGTTQINVDQQEWAAGIWVGTTKHKIEIFDSSLATKRAEFTIAGYSIDDKTVTVSEDLTAGGGGSVAAGDIIFFSSAYSVADGHKDMVGLHAISEEKTSLFGISNAAEPLFQANIVDVGTSSVAEVISFAKVEEAVARAVEKGLGEEEMTVLVNVNSWNDLLTEQTAKRRFGDAKYDVLKEGAKEIRFVGQAGDIKIVPSTYIKEGYAYAMCEKDLMRIGSSDITFEAPGYEGKFARMLDNHNGFEIRAYSDQALFTSRPSCITQLRYIKNSTHS